MTYKYTGKSRTNAKKYACAAESVFFGGALSAKRRFIETSSELGPSQIDAIMGPPLRESNPIRRHIDSTFATQTRYVARQFNSEHFPAYYTTHEVETCVQEQRERAPHLQDSLVVFSIYYTGRTADLVPHVKKLNGSAEDNHAFAATIRDQDFAAVAWPARSPNKGTFCAIFDPAAVSPGDVLRERYRVEPTTGGQPPMRRG